MTIFVSLSSAADAAAKRFIGAVSISAGATGYDDRWFLGRAGHRAARCGSLRSSSSFYSLSSIFCCSYATLNSSGLTIGLVSSLLCCCC